MQELYNTGLRSSALLLSESQNAMQLSAILNSRFKDVRGQGLGQQAINRITLDRVRDKDTAVLKEYEVHEPTISVVGAVAQRFWEIGRTLQHGIGGRSSSGLAVNWGQFWSCIPANQL